MVPARAATPMHAMVPARTFSVAQRRNDEQKSEDKRTEHNGATDEAFNLRGASGLVALAGLMGWSLFAGPTLEEAVDYKALEQDLRKLIASAGSYDDGRYGVRDRRARVARQVSGAFFLTFAAPGSYGPFFIRSVVGCVIGQCVCARLTCCTGWHGTRLAPTASTRRLAAATARRCGSRPRPTTAATLVRDRWGRVWWSTY